MNHEMYETMRGRLEFVRETADRLRQLQPDDGKKYVRVIEPGQGHYEGGEYVIDRPSVVQAEGEPGSLLRRLSEEAAGLVDLLVGDDPLVLDAIEWLRAEWRENSMVMHTKRNGEPAEGHVVLTGNEHWVFADVQVGDDYGAWDFELKHAIWRNTGALYRVERDGAVADDPIYVPEGSPYTGPLEEAHGGTSNRR